MSYVQVTCHTCQLARCPEASAAASACVVIRAPLERHRWQNDHATKTLTAVHGPSPPPAKDLRRGPVSAPDALPPLPVPAVPWPAGYQLLTVRTPARLWSRSRGPPCSCRRVLVPPYPLWAAAHQEWEWRLHACMVASSSGTCRCTDGLALQWIPEIAVGLCFICQCRWLAAAHSGFVHALTCRAVPCRGSAGPLAISPCDNLRLCTSSTCMEEQTVTWHHPCGP